MPGGVVRHLRPDEESIVVRIHPAIFLGSVILALAGLAGAGALTAAVAGGNGIGQAVIWVLWFALLLRMIWKIMSWRVMYLVVTRYRLMLVTGLLENSARAITLAQVTDLATRQSFPGRILGYGELVVECAEQGQALRRVRFVPYLEQLYLEICGSIFLEPPPPSGSPGPPDSSLSPGDPQPPPGSPSSGPSEPLEPQPAWLSRPVPPKKPSPGAARLFQEALRS
jgi:hypothetical protein